MNARSKFSLRHSTKAVVRPHPGHSKPNAILQRHGIVKSRPKKSLIRTDIKKYIPIAHKNL